MEFHPTAKSLLEEIAENAEKLTLTHTEVIGIVQVLETSNFIEYALSKSLELNFYIDAIKIYGLTHKQRSFFAKRALHIVEVYETKKYQESPMTPENF